MLLRRFYEKKLAQASYMIGCQATGVALVVDPHRDSEVYLRAAAEEGLTITHVSETHIHADYLSGARQLARRSDATLLLSGEGGIDWQYAFVGEEHTQAVHNGDEIEVGNVVIEILPYPGSHPRTHLFHDYGPSCFTRAAGRADRRFYLCRRCWPA